MFAALAMAAPAHSAGAMPVVDPNASQPASCPATSRYEAARRSKDKPGVKKLSELPPGDAYFAVYRHIGRCEAPMLVKFGVGDR
jgi:hypothetical protein